MRFRTWPDLVTQIIQYKERNRLSLSGKNLTRDSYLFWQDKFSEAY